MSSVISNKKPPKKRVLIRSPKGGSTIKSGSDLMVWRKKRGISRKLFAQMADCSERTLATCEKAALLPETIERPITETVRLIRALQELAGDNIALKDWLLTPNPAFGKRMPLTLIKNGEADLLWEMVYQLRQGAFA